MENTKKWISLADDWDITGGFSLDVVFKEDYDQDYDGCPHFSFVVHSNYHGNESGMVFNSEGFSQWWCKNEIDIDKILEELKPHLPTDEGLKDVLNNSLSIVEEYWDADCEDDDEVDWGK